MADHRGEGLGWALAAWVAFALLATGSVGLFERGLLQLGLLGLLGWAWWAGRHARVGELSRAVAPVTVAVASGLLLVPAAVLGGLAPGVAASRPEAGWWTLSARPDLVIGGLATWSLLVGVAGLAWQVLPELDRATVERRLAWATVGWAVFGAAHALTGSEALFGLLPVRPGLGRFYAPLVNPNHHGVVLWMGAPFALAQAEAAWRGRRAELAVWVALFAWMLCFPWLSASMGLLFAAAGLGALGVLQLRSMAARLGAVALGLGAVMAGALGVQSQQLEWWAVSGAPRLAQWSDAIAMWRDHPWFGVGAGAYEAAYPPYRTVPQFARFAHAHSDLIEVAVELGVVGLALGGLALWRVRRLGEGDGRWLAALSVLALHGLVDFPWHVPAVAALGVVVAMGALGRPVAAPRAGGAWVVALVLGQALGAAWWWHGVAVERWVAAGDTRSLAWVEAVAPWRAEPALAEVARRAQAGTLDEAALREVAVAFPDDAGVLRVLGVQAVSLGASALAESLLAASVQRDPNDFRTWAVRAEVAAQGGEHLRAAEFAAQGLVRRPRDYLDEGAPLKRAYAWLPVGPWWLEALREAPAHWSVRLAWMMLEEGDFETALAACEQAGTQREVAHAYMAACAQALLGLGRREEARAYVERWVVEDPEDAWGWSTRAGLDRDDGEQVQWRRSAARAFLLRPDHPKVRRQAQEAAQSCAGCGPAAPCATRCEGGEVVDLWAAWQAPDVAGCEAALERAFSGVEGRVLRSRCAWSCAARDQQ